MHKDKRSKTEVGQLTLTFVLPETETKDAAQETQTSALADNESPSSTMCRDIVGSVHGEVNPSGARSGRKGKWNSLIDKVYAYRTIEQAWDRVRENNGAAGVDGMTIARFERDASEFSSAKQVER